MQFSENWLRTMVDPKMTSDELAHLLTMSGLEVEDVDPVAPPFSNVVVGLVLEMEKHPNADRLNVCQVDVGTGTMLNIVCGAPNVRPGLKVVCAMAGAVLPPGADGKPVRFNVTVDGQAPGDAHGTDVAPDGSGTVTEQRLYQLVRQPGAVQDHTFTIEFLDPNVAAYAFTFG